MTDHSRADSAAADPTIPKNATASTGLPAAASPTAAIAPTAATAPTDPAASTGPAATTGSTPATTAATAPDPRPRSRQRRNPATDLALIATFAALIAVCAILPAISLGPVPFTLQTFAIVLTGAVLGARRGFFAALLYLAVGAIGLPVFAGGSAGLAPFAGPTMGYLVSFPFAAAAAGFIASRIPRRGAVATTLALLLATVVGVAVNHVLGIAGLAWRGGMSVGQAAIVDVAFLPLDLVKALLAAIVATAVHRAFPALLPVRVRR
ncbi:biotin transporter BioY [Leucobacter tenebrionis]|uniref:biotin transporter BioY n=1 Tax=Leucobacter tenebrionis TaxID=2873270 RepID=UPI001CA63DD1|nr:biotin transporter BioY [Leucobacter tenebrionis]QZY50931.1 biotin transporter BioY [Leucobacter tenebrionis]